MISYHAMLHYFAEDNVKFDIETFIQYHGVGICIIYISGTDHQRQYFVSIGDYIKTSGFIFQNLSNNH